jgi:hypothetical protein
LPLLIRSFLFRFFVVFLVLKHTIDEVVNDAQTSSWTENGKLILSQFSRFQFVAKTDITSEQDREVILM